MAVLDHERERVTDDDEAARTPLDNFAPPELDHLLLNSSRLMILSMLPIQDWCRLSIISEAASISHGHCSRHVAALRNAGYVTVFLNRRTLLVQITALGRERLAAHASALRAIVVEAGALDESADAADSIPRSCLERQHVRPAGSTGATLPVGKLVPPTAEQLDAFARIMGDELRAVRNGLGWIREDLRERLVANGHLCLQTFASYELGSRKIPLVRMVELCLAMGESPDVVLGRACQRAFGDNLAVNVDLHALASTEIEELRPLREWAAVRLRDQSAGERPTRLIGEALENLAQLCGVPVRQLVTTLQRL
jgi:DNA-binding MarR family transcriptional regulator